MEKITVDIPELETQIYALLESNLNEEAKSGLHELLGAIMDGLIKYQQLTLYRHEQ
jgi:hypothetical protein